IALAFRRVGRLSEVIQRLEKLRTLTDEKAHCGQEVNHIHGNSIGFSRTNNRTYRERCAEEVTRLRHDQVRLEVLSAKRWTIEIRKNQSISRVSQRGRIPGFVRPGLEVHRLGGANADQDS